jgi:tagatose 6-phosphate kinase
MILVVGLSPAWQRTLVFEEIVPGKVNRAVRVTETASGKGVNVARVASILGADVKLLTVAGGERGQLLKAQLKRRGLTARVVAVNAETRICQTLLARGATTELVEEAGPLTSREVREVLRSFGRDIQSAELVVLTGSVPKGCGDDFYARLIGESTRHGVQVLIDTQKVQLRNALKRRPFLVRINRDELTAATGIKGAGRKSVLPALGKLMRRGPHWAVISNGAKGIYVSEIPGSRASSVTPPRVEAKNAIGSGDAMMAGIAVGLVRGRSMLEAVRFGAACGAANAMTTEPGFVRMGDVRRLCWTHNRRDFIV